MNKLTKQQALEKIKELEKYPEYIDIINKRLNALNQDKLL